MTDEGIAEIYALARETFKGGNSSFQLQVFPFRMTTANMARHATSPHMDFWKDIKEGHDYFELTKTPPVWDVCEKQYIFNPASAGPLSATGTCPPSVQNPALTAKLKADEADLAAKAGDARLAAERKAAEQAALEARGEAVNSFFSGIGENIGGLFGAQPGAEATTGLPTPVTQRP